MWNPCFPNLIKIESSYKKCRILQKMKLDMIDRPIYLQKLINSKDNGFPKVITGLRRCGKSYLLTDIYPLYLRDEEGIEEDFILYIALDDDKNEELRDPIELGSRIRSMTADKNKRYYVFLDEIQKVFTIVNPKLTDGKHVLATEKDSEVISFVDVVLGLSREKNIDLYVTGSNSKMLSSDIISEFRDKATEIHVQPLSFAEYHTYSKQDPLVDYFEYALHGGMPLAVLKNGSEKEEYLSSLFKKTYFKDILEHHHFRKDEVLDEACTFLSQTVGQLLNVVKLADRMRSEKKASISRVAISDYVDAFEDAFLIRKAERFDLKGGAIIGATRKYYFADTGLRNARLGFAFPDMGQVMENIIFNELLYHGYQVSIGCFDTVEKKNGESVRVSHEVDFYAKRPDGDLYIQSCYSIGDANVKAREKRPFDLLHDSRRKVIVVADPIPPSKTEEGYEILNITDFLLGLH